MIEADIDRYGSEIRPSALADFLEVSAMLGAPCSFAHLKDIINDRWPRTREMFSVPSDLGQDDDIFDQDESEYPESFEDIVDQVRSTIAERSDVLDEKYPFQLLDHGIQVKKGSDLLTSAYTVLLCLSVCHAYKIPTSADVTQLLEDIVENSLSMIGLRSHNLGRLARETKGGFPSLLEKLSIITGIMMSTANATYRKSANDGGVDIFAYVPLIDRRRGRWVMLGQVTCGKSNTWVNKHSEVEVDRWRRILNDSLTPMSFLAVPHHVNSRAWEYLTDGNVNMIIDRIRLTAMLPTKYLPGKDLVLAVQQSEIETLLY